MKITDERKDSGVVLNIGKIPMGTVFSGNLVGYEDTIFLRIYDGIVSLEDPDKTWTWDFSLAINIDNYRPLNAELVIKD